MVLSPTPPIKFIKYALTHALIYTCPPLSTITIFTQAAAERLISQQDNPQLQELRVGKTMILYRSGQHKILDLKLSVVQEKKCITLQVGKEKIKENWLKRWHNSALPKAVAGNLSEDRHHQTVEGICLTLVRPADGP